MVNKTTYSANDRVLFVLRTQLLLASYRSSYQTCFSYCHALVCCLLRVEWRKQGEREATQQLRQGHHAEVDNPLPSGRGQDPQPVQARDFGQAAVGCEICVANVVAVATPISAVCCHVTTKSVFV